MQVGVPPPAENVQTSVGACQQEAAGQLSTASALDAKLMGILAFMAAVAGLLLTVSKGLDSDRWLLLVGAGGAILIALLGLIGSEDPKSGPDPIDFYETFGALGPTKFAEQLMADLGRTIRSNTECLTERRSALSASVIFASLAAIAFGVVRLLV